MKRIISVTALLLISFICSAQTFSPEVVKRAIVVKQDSTLKSKYVIAPPYDYSAPLKLTTPALQLTFTRVEQIDGEWKLTTPILIGYSYIYSLANGVIHRDSSITVENKFFFGGGFNLGVTPTLEGSLETSIPIGAIIGYNRYGAFGGIDILTGKPMFGISINLLGVPVLQSLTKIKIGEY